MECPAVNDKTNRCEQVVLRGVDVQIRLDTEDRGIGESPSFVRVSGLLSQPDVGPYLTGQQSCFSQPRHCGGLLT
jgi:hypothetical protein